MNYAFGLTRVSFRDYFFASWMGMLPGTFMCVYAGSLAGDLASIGKGSRPPTPAEWTIYGIGLLAAIVVTACVTRFARRALRPRLETSSCGQTAGREGVPPVGPENHCYTWRA